MDKIEKLDYRPFTRFCMSIGAVPSSYIAGLTIEEQLLWFCSYLEKEVIPTVNNNGEAVEELQKLYIELKDYLDNLDLQDEVNNKLDEMAESGELSNIIAQFLNANCILKFDNIQEMVESEALHEGNIVEVFGNENINDGFINYYYITNEETNISLQNNLYAKLLYNEKVDGSYLYDEIEQHELYVENSKSTVQIFKIPNKDKFNKTIEMKHGFANDIISNTPANEKPSTFSDRKNATLCINASIFDVDTTSPNYNKILGLIIHNGNVVTDTRQYYMQPDWYKNRYILGLKNTGILKAYVGNLQSQVLIDDGVVESWQGFIPVLENGQNTRDSLLSTHNWTAPVYALTSDVTPNKNKIYYILDSGEYVGQYHLDAFNPNLTYYEQTVGGRYPRQIIAQNETTKDFYILSANGKGKTQNLGTTFEEVIVLLKYVDSDITFAYALDEGGSTATIYENINRINPTDDQTYYSRETKGIGKSERTVPDFIYFSKEIQTQKDKDINYILAEVEKLKNDVRVLRLDENANSVVRNDDGLHIENWSLTALNNLFLLFSQRQNDGTMKPINAIVSNVTNAPGSLSMYDRVNDRTVARVKDDGERLVNENGTGLLPLANIFKKIKKITDFNALRDTCITMGFGNATGAPFTDNPGRINFVISLFTTENSNFGCQIGLFGGSAPSQMAYRCFYDGNTWTAWRYINFDS